MSTAKDVQRQIAVATVIAVEEAPFLLAVQGVVGSVQIQDDLVRRLVVTIQEDLDKEAIDRLRIDGDSSVAIP